MGYRITYENGVIRKRIVRIRRFKWKPWSAGVIATVFVLMLMLPSGRLWIRNLLLPGDEEVTAAALESMVSNLRSGESVGETLEVFCKEIIAGGT